MGICSVKTGAVVKQRLFDDLLQYTCLHCDLGETVSRQKSNVTGSPRPYQPDLARSDFFISPDIKIKMKVHPPDAIELVVGESQELIKVLASTNLEE